MHVIVFLLLFLIDHVFGQEIIVAFNRTVTLNTSIFVVWLNSTDLSCDHLTTTSSIMVGLETSATQQNEMSSMSTSVPEVYSTTQDSEENLTTGSASVQPVDLYTCLGGAFGVHCNISSDICTIAYPCLNGGNCSLNSNQSVGYTCQCPSGFTGDECQYDGRVCAANTCWNNGRCSEINQTSSTSNNSTFNCQCLLGYDGLNCETSSNMCVNITCENQAICKSSHLSWSCQCLDSSLYSGTYCEQKSSSLTAKEILSKSFAIVAIIFICLVVSFVIIMDVLKYGFNIDPADRELHRMRLEREKKEQTKFRKKKAPKVYFVSSLAQ